MINNGNHQDTVNVFTLDSIFIVLKDGGHKGWMGGYSLCTQTFFNLHFFLLASLFLPSLFLSTHPTPIFFVIVNHPCLLHRHSSLHLPRHHVMTIFRFKGDLIFPSNNKSIFRHLCLFKESSLYFRMTFFSCKWDVM